MLATRRRPKVHISASVCRRCYAPMTTRLDLSLPIVDLHIILATAPAVLVCQFCRRDKFLQSEGEVTADVVAFMQAQGWRAERKDVRRGYTPDGRRFSVGRKGQPDWKFTRTVDLGTQEVCWVEMKATGAKPDKHQLEYMAKLKVVHGEPAWWADSLLMHVDQYVEVFGT